MKTTVGLAFFLLLSIASSRADEEGIAYLMSVSFSAPRLNEWTAEKVRQFNATPYRGIASRLAGAYTYVQGVPPTPKDFADAVEQIKTHIKPGRHVWPWIFLNRIIAPNPERSHSGAPKRKLVLRFRGIDLDGAGGALDDFYATWRTALRLAKQLEAPGIVFDPEAYSDYSVSNVRYLAQTSGKSSDEVVALIKRIGAHLADITGDEFPNAIIWTLFTQFQIDDDLRTTAPILFDGMLTRAKEKNMPLALVDGGETVGYAFINLANLRRCHNLRSLQVSKYLARYGARLVMGGTIAPWAEAKERSTWMSQWPSCVRSVFKTIDDFEPVFVDLMRRYRYLWIYAASAAPYNPLKPESAGRYNPTIKRALAKAAHLGPLQTFEIAKLSDLENARAFTKDLAADAKLWTVGGGREASMTAILHEEGGRGIRFIVKVDTTRHGDEKYPAGWLFLNRDLGDAGDLGEAIGIRLQIRFHQEGKIRIGLREMSGTNPQWISIWPKKVGEWKDVAIPIELFALEDPKGIRRLSFYVAEGWYLHGDNLTFDIRKIFFCKK